MTTTQENHTEIFSDPSTAPIALAQGSPSGLAWVANSRQDSKTGETSSTWIHADHVDYLDQQLVALAARELKRQGYVGLIIEEPPRVGKSELTSHYFPAWYAGAYPDHRIMLGSYEADFAATWGGKVRDTLMKFGPPIFGIDISRSSSATNRWNLDGHKGGMTTAGVGGSFTGRGAHLLIIDDPIKNAKDADSETYRNNLWNWFKTTARTRLEPDGIICVVMTRWHEDDLVGRLIKAMEEDPEADQYLRIRLPMIAEGPDDYADDEVYVPDALGRKPGTILFPERFSKTNEPNKINIGPNMAAADRTWWALYQQRPTTVEGAMMNPAWFEVVPRTAVPPLKKIVRRWDMAATEEGEGYDPDWTVGAKVGVAADGTFYIMHITRFRESPGKVEARIKATASTDGRGVKIKMEQEPGSSGKTVISHFRRKVLSGYNFRGERSTGNKVLRAEVLASHAEQGDVKVVSGTWNALFFAEVRRFPRGAHDDQVDAVAGGMEDLTKKTGGKVVTW